ncbi:MAG: SDR family NAD(P)-dependent oxidoreductase [Hyphomicrobiaceae bacterium]
MDTQLLPELAEHVVSGQVILPGSAFVEIALAVGQQWLESSDIIVSDLAILKPLALPANETREILTRVAPGSNTFEILSRPRLSTADWLLHARGKLYVRPTREVDKTQTAPTFDARARSGAANSNSASSIDQRHITRAELYALAQLCGLDYGPAFRLVNRVERKGARRIQVELDESRVPREYLLDPTLLDACFHGLFVLFPELGGEHKGSAFIPIRFDEIALHCAGFAPSAAQIEIRRAGPRTVLADFHLLSSDGSVIARLTGARFAAVATRRRIGLEQTAVVERLRPLPDPTRRLAPTTPGTARGMLDILGNEATAAFANKTGDGKLLLEGWAAAAAIELARALARDEVLDVSELVTTERIPSGLRDWLSRVLRRLQAAGLTEKSRKRAAWQLLPDPDLPSAAEILTELLNCQPEYAPEIHVAADVGALVKRFVDDGAIAAGAIADHSSVSKDYFDLAGSDVSTAAELLVRSLSRAGVLADGSEVSNVLVLGDPRLIHHLASSPGCSRLKLTFFDPDRRCDFGTLVPSASVATIDRLDALKDQSFDLVLGINGLNRLDADGVSEICRATMPRAPVVNLQPPASLFDELACGLYSHAGVRRSLDDGLMARSLSACCSLLQAGGFEILEATSVLPGKFNWNAVIAVAPETSESLNGQVVQEKDITGAQAENATPVAAVVVGSETSPRSTALCDALCAGVDIVRTRIDNLAELVGAPSSVAVLLPPIEQDGQPNDALVRRCLLLKQVVEELKGTRCAVWVVEQLIAAVAEQQLAIKDGTCAYCRTLTNEYPNLTIRQVEICADVPVDSAAGHLTDLLTAGTQESEIVIAADGLSAMRVEPLQSNLIPLLPRATTARLERTGLPGQRVAWQAMERTAPGPGQVEIEVVATGLNFRDLMWAMDLLPEDMLENGFTGPALGLECAGRVSRVGPGVSYVAGECVVALAPSAFATHVVVDERMVAKVPDSIALEAAATVPVAFLTARYSLVTLANLHAGERVLIHGAAGAVGLAAIQIAQERGAEVIATAGSEAKRSLLRSLGVAHVFDSRSTHFVDEVLALTGDGVDVVLNSLAGAAMERSLHCVKPFGRFVELGKRDYVSNTHIGLRPFRRNLTYFGVDIDQLIEGRPDLGQDIFCSVTRLLREGRLTPLPYAVFESSRINDAFQLMQQSAHIGKIVVRPPPPDTVAAYPKPFEIDAERTHLVTGGLGGFGLATARWLVERGAKNLVLLGRSGAAGEIATSAVTAMQERGAHVTVANCDIADVEALDATLRRIRATMPPLAGIVHAAMVLEDGLIANLDRGQLERVLAPKVAGAANLDRLTREDPIEYFVLYSSITSLIGNPGQASYVAANGYLEGLARARRRQGLPGLAIGWGPIADVGIVARNSTLKESLLERRGLASMTARDALDLLGDALSVTGCDPALAALTMAPREFKGGAQRLPILRSPSFALLMGSDSPDTSPANDRLDIAALLAVEDSATVKRQVTSLIVCRLAAILHMREDEINQARPLADLGIDSLMTLELASSIESAVGMPLAVSGTMATHSISMLADQIIAQAGNIPPDGDDFKTSTLVQKHFEAVAPEHMAIVTAIAAEQKHTAEGVRN